MGRLNRIRNLQGASLAAAGALLLPGLVLGAGAVPGPQASPPGLRELFAAAVAQNGAFDLSPDGRLLAASQDDGSISVVDTASGNAVRTLTLQEAGSATDLRFSPDGRLLAAASAAEVVIWDVASGVLSHRLTVQAESMAFSPNDLALAVGEGGASMAVKVFDVRSGAMIRSWQAGPPAYGGVYNLAFTPDGRYLFSGQGHEGAKEWDPERGVMVRALAGELPYWNPGQALAFSPDGHLLALWDHGQCEIVDPSIGSFARVATVGLGGEPLGFTSDGRWLMVLLDSELGEGGPRQHEIAVWDLGAGKTVEIIPLGTYPDFAVSKVLLSAGSQVIAWLQGQSDIRVATLLP